MNKIFGLLLVMVLVAGTSTMVQAREDNNGSGCGVGKKVFDGESGMGAHLGAWFINTIIGWQSSSMTSQTSGCRTDGVVNRDNEQEVFVAANLDQLSQEMAQGSGQHLRALSSLMGCSTSVYGDFAGMAQDKYELLFTATDTSTLNLLSGLKREMSANPALAGACTRIS